MIRSIQHNKIAFNNFISAIFNPFWRFTYKRGKQSTLLYRTFSAFLVFAFITSSIIPPQKSYAQVGAYGHTPLLNLPAPGTMISLSPTFNPPIIKGITIHPENPLLFDFIVHPGDDNLQDQELKDESTKLIKYFMASLTVPEDQMWVNLSPYEKDRIVPDSFGQTEMGRDLLAQDYLLKQLTASLMYPEDELGSEFWKRVYKKAYEKYGTSEIPMNTFNKIWIVPETASIYEKGTSIFVVDSHLKVMLEEDYLALEVNRDSNKHGAVGAGLKPARTVNSEIVSGVSSEIIREILIPEIEKEVNEGKTFANLRQIYNSVILATWYKQNLKESLLGQVYVDQNKTKGIEIEDKQINQKIYDQYLKAFKVGVYNYIKEDYDPATQEIIPRKYFSGGVGLAGSPIAAVEPPGAFLSSNNKVFEVRLDVAGDDNAALPVSFEDLGLGVKDHRLPSIAQLAARDGGEYAIAASPIVLELEPEPAEVQRALEIDANMIIEKARRKIKLRFKESGLSKMMMSVTAANDTTRVRVAQFTALLSTLEKEDKEIVMHLIQHFTDPGVARRARKPVELLELLRDKSPELKEILDPKVIKLTVWMMEEIMAKRFFVGENVKEAYKVVKEMEAAGYEATVDVLGDESFTKKDRERYVQTYLDMIDEGIKNVSVKVSNLYENFSPESRDLSKKEVEEHLEAIFRRAAKEGAGVTLDMEYATYKDLTMEIFLELVREVVLETGYSNFSIALQHYFSGEETRKDIDKIEAFYVAVCPNNANFSEKQHHLNSRGVGASNIQAPSKNFQKANKK